MIHRWVTPKDAEEHPNPNRIIRCNSNDGKIIMETNGIHMSVSGKDLCTSLDLGSIPFTSDSPQSGPFVPTNPPVDHANAINVRRHLYSPSQLPQGLTEGQLVMLLQKGNQHQQTPAAAQPVPVQSQPIQTEIQVIENDFLVVREH